jgi:hypothetical protein
MLAGLRLYYVHIAVGQKPECTPRTYCCELGVLGMPGIVTPALVFSSAILYSGGRCFIFISGLAGLVSA